MKTVFNKQMLLSTVLLGGTLARINDFSSLPVTTPTQSFNLVSASQQNYGFDTQWPQGDLSALTPKKVAVINHKLTKLQEGIYGDFLAEYVSSAPQEYMAD